jgi:hypothetical protein
MMLVLWVLLTWLVSSVVVGVGVGRLLQHPVNTDSWHWPSRSTVRRLTAVSPRERHVA